MAPVPRARSFLRNTILLHAAAILRTFTAVLVLGLGGCSALPFFGDKDDEVDVAEDRSEMELYQASQRSMRASNYETAIAQLQALEARYPFGRYAEQAQLELIYAYYMNFKPDLARSSADRFIRLHPQHPNVDYAFYLKGLAAFEKDQSFIDRFFPTETASRDVGSARDSFADFGQLLARYPSSEYAPDARQRMVYLRNLLARSEILSGRFYLERDAYVAAVNRGRNVVENFPSTPSVPDGLALMIEGYLKLNLPEPANDALKVLAENYPTYPNFDENGRYVISQALRNRDRSFLNIATFGLLDDPESLEPIELSVDRPGAPLPPTPSS